VIGSPIERRKVYTQIAERLLGQIGAGHLRPGDPLPTERQLTQSFRVGRSSVREALRILESQGVIKPVDSGAFVVADASSPLYHSLDLLLTLQGATLRELFEVRKILEAESAALAATRRTESELLAMAGAIEEMKDSLQTQERYIAADLRFHLTIAAATRNRMTQHMMQAIRAPLQHALGSIYYIPGSAQRSIDQHRQILQAIRLGDPAAARQRMREHLARVESDIDGMLSPHPASGPNPVRMGGRRG
jgi:GntR family transcriptional regulator, transcriptional repressor for pyruvate dehydrogenase complex